MKFILSLALLCACSSSSPSVNEPIPCVTSLTDSAVCPACPQPTPCPASTTSPVVTTSPPAPNVGDPVYEERRRQGWYCFQMNYVTPKRWQIDACHRTIEQCNESLEHSRLLSQKTGQVQFQPCTPRSTAACFRLTNPRERYDFLKCYGTLQQCIVQWGDSMNDSVAWTRHTQCEQTE